MRHKKHMTDGDINLFEHYVRRNSKTLQARQVPDAIDSVLRTICDEFLRSDNYLSAAKSFANDWMDREMRVEDLSAMRLRDITEQQYRAEKYMECFLNHIVLQMGRKLEREGHYDK